MECEYEKVLITGAAGQLGKELERQLGPLRAIPRPHEVFDITNLAAIREWLPILNPDVVINCAAYTNPILAEQHPEDCWRVNALAVGNLARTCADAGIPFVHISSDYVFGQD